MSINWKVRFKHKTFWLALIPALLLLVQVCAAPFGYAWDFGVLNEQLAAIVNALFALLTLLGITTDPTTAGVSDSTQAMSYEKPRNDKLAADGYVVGEEDEIDWTIGGTDE